MPNRRSGAALHFAAAVFLLTGSLAAGEDPRFDCRQEVPGASQCLFIVFAQLAAGGGFSGEIIVTNQGYQDDEAVRLDFFADDGTPLALETDLGMVAERIFSLRAGESRIIPFSLDSEVAIPGYGRLTFSSSASLRGSLLLRVIADESLQTEVGVRADIPRSSYTFPAEVDNARSINTGLALANGAFQRVNLPDPAAQGFVISLIELDGSVRGTAVLPLGLNGHTSLFLDDPRLFPGLDGFRGSVSVSAGVDFGLLALRLESGLLTSVANDFGPVLGAFDIRDTTPEIPEVEPNSSAGTAQLLTLPANVAGVIDNEFSDLFQIAATGGQVLTVYTVTQRGVSFLDTYLAVERPDGTVLAVNDQNELIFRNDGFLRMEIPEDGTYILRVEDFFFGEGPDFTYNLLVQLDPPPGP
ncbi:MAG: PPC domain-containing protein [Acidobacteriota bacterium]